MVKLNDGFDHIDSVGIPHEKLTPEEDLNLGVLIILGLATLDAGRGEQAWCRLTEMGRKMREEGGA